MGGRYMSPDDAPRMQAVVDEAARAAGREPSAVERAVNLMALSGPPNTWADQLARVRELGFTSLLVAVPSDDPAGTVRRLGEEVQPRLLELVG
jgi:hypothetical protein